MNVSFDTFICANSKDGFFTYQDDLMKMDNITVIKGGPGTGKSTLMRKIATFYEQQGLSVEKIHCSSDPNSLDGVYIIDKSSVYFDGTSPHAQELPLPGAGCRLLDLGMFWNTENLKQQKEKISQFNNEIKAHYSKAYNLLKAAGQCADVCDYITEPFCDNKKLEKYIKNLSQKLFPPLKHQGIEHRRFSYSISHLGSFCFDDTYSKICEKVYKIVDNNSYILPIILEKIKNNANKAGYETTAFFSPLDPKKCEFLYIKELKLGIGNTSNANPYLKINTLRFLNCEALKEYRNRIRFYKKMQKELINDAVTEFKKIKKLHDDLESIYIKEMDFGGVNKLIKKELV